MEETLGLVLAVNQEPPQVSPPFLQEASPRCCLPEPSPPPRCNRHWLPVRRKPVGAGARRNTGLKALLSGNSVQAVLLHSAGRSSWFGRALDPGETSPGMGTPGVGVLLPAWCPARTPWGRADSEPRAASGFLLGCRHRASAEPGKSHQQCRVVTLPASEEGGRALEQGCFGISPRGS